MRLTLDVVIDQDGEAHVFVRRVVAVDDFRVTWGLWERPELAGEISDAVAETIDALQAEANETMRAFLRAAPTRLAAEERLPPRGLVEPEWSA